jgi:hypothetical protein
MEGIQGMSKTNDVRDAVEDELPFDPDVDASDITSPAGGGNRLQLSCDRGVVRLHEADQRSP